MLSQIVTMVRLLSVSMISFLIVVLLLFGVDSASRKKDAQAIQEDVVEFSSTEDMNSKLEEIQKSRNVPDEIGEDELITLEQEAPVLKKKLDKALREHGENSRDVASALHALGRNMYKRGRIDEVYSVSKRIVAIHEVLDGPEHVDTAQALANVGSVAFRLKDSSACELAMERALYILIKAYGDNSKEVQNIV